MNKKRLMGVLIILLALMLNGCVKQPYEPSGLITMPEELVSQVENIPVETQELDAIIQIEEEIISLENETIILGNDTPIVTKELKEEEEEEEEEELTQIKVEDIVQSLPAGVFKKITVKEKEIVTLNVNAQDPDGNQLMYLFSTPLSEEGEWQTKRGDVGEYIVNITVSDGELETMAKVLVVVESINKEPIMEKIENIAVKEGDKIVLEPKATDGNDDTIVFSFSGLMDSEEYEVSYNDVVCEEEVFNCLKIFTTTITASDGFSEVVQNVGITVTNTNRAPSLSALEDITIDEEELVEIEASATDSDGDEITFSFTAPLDDQGKLQSKRGDVGKYIIYVTASDRDLSTSEKLTLTINSINEAPILTAMDDLVIDETDTITLSPTATDANNDTVAFTFSGWMNSNTFETGYDDSGEHTVTITAMDQYGGIDTVDLTITVNNVNRPPVIVDVS